MARATTRSLFVAVAPGQTRAICPVVDLRESLLVLGKDGKPTDESAFLVKGSIERLHPETGTRVFLDLDQRWLEIGAALIKPAVAQALKDGTVNRVRMLSFVAGNSVSGANGQQINVPGSEPAYLLQLTGSDEAKAIAHALGVDYAVTVPVGRDQIAVTHTNPIIVAATVMCALGHGLWAPKLEREREIPSRADARNPEYQQALAFFDATGKLPERVAANTRFNEDFGSRFLGGAQPAAGRGRAQAAGQGADFF